IAGVEHFDPLSDGRCRSAHLGSISANPPLRKYTPVALPLGRLKLVTSPALIGSFSLPKTMGIVVVAAFAATVAIEPAGIAITFTRRRTSSAASAGKRSN